MSEQEAIEKLNECIEFFRWFNTVLGDLFMEHST